MTSRSGAVSVFIVARRTRGVEPTEPVGCCGGEAAGSRDGTQSTKPPGMLSSAAFNKVPLRVRFTYPGLAAKYRRNTLRPQHAAYKQWRAYTVLVAAISALVFAASSSAATVKPVPAHIALAFKKAAVAARHGGQIQCLHGVDNTRGYPIATYGCTFYRKNPKGKTTLTVGKRKVRVTVSRVVTAELLAPHSVQARMARCLYTVDDTAHTVYDGRWDVCEAGWQQHVPFLSP